jgi:hypothetical protein
MGPVGFVPINIVGTMPARMILHHERESIQGFRPKAPGVGFEPPDFPCLIG